MCSALKYRSHRLPNFMFRQRSSQIGVVLSRDRLVVPLSTRPSLILISNLIIDASSISTLIKFFSLVKSVNNVSRSVAWSGITIDWARPTTSSSTRRIIIIESRSSSPRVAKGGRRVVSVSGLPSTSRNLINSTDRSPMTRSS